MNKIILCLFMVLFGVTTLLSEQVFDHSLKEAEGIASWYGNESICWQWGGHTRNGEMFDENKLTCALPDKSQLNKFYLVTNLDNGKSVVVWGNDTGSFKKYGRIIDLSKRAFSQISELDKGLIKVKIEELKK